MCAARRIRKWPQISPVGKIAVPYLIGYTLLAAGMASLPADASIPRAVTIPFLIVVAPGEFPLPGPMWPRLHWPMTLAGAVFMLICMVVNVYLWSLLIAAVAGSIHKHSRGRGERSGSLDQ